MPHDISLVSTIAVSLVYALIFGFIAVRLRLPPLIGYLLAGVAVGPFTPGFVADTHLAPQLAEIGIMLLMFGVGMHFSIKDLLAVRATALPGAIIQMLAATVLGLGAAWLWKWPLGAGLVFGLALSVASTVVLLRALETLDAVESREGRIAIGWLIVEDLVMVLVLVLLPALAVPLGGHPAAAQDTPASADAGGNLAITIAITLGKIAAFVFVMLLAGKRLLPWLLARIERTKSPELFTLAVIAAALGVAFGSAELFGVSFALGSFFAGLVINESDYSHRAAKDLRPLQDAFSVLFFVAVGMLFDPKIIVENPVKVLVTVAIIILGKGLTAFVLAIAFRCKTGPALVISAGLTQIGEFSFILAGLGITLGLLPGEGRQLILAGALISITLNPLIFRALGRFLPYKQQT